MYVKCTGWRSSDRNAQVKGQQPLWHSFANFNPSSVGSNIFWQVHSFAMAHDTMAFCTPTAIITLCTWWHHQMETFSALLAVWEGNPLVAGVSPSHRPVIQSLMLSLICAWTNGWANNQNASDLRHHHAHYNITVMSCVFCYGFRPLELHGYWHAGDIVMLNIGIASMMFWL